MHFLCNRLRSLRHFHSSLVKFGWTWKSAPAPISASFTTLEMVEDLLSKNWKFTNNYVSKWFQAEITRSTQLGTLANFCGKTQNKTSLFCGEEVSKHHRSSRKLFPKTWTSQSDSFHGIFRQEKFPTRNKTLKPFQSFFNSWLPVRWFFGNPFQLQYLSNALEFWFFLLGTTISQYILSQSLEDQVH